MNFLGIDLLPFCYAQYQLVKKLVAKMEELKNCLTWLWEAKYSNKLTGIEAHQQ